MHHAGSKQWYVVYTKPKGEELARSHLTLKGIEAFYPQLLLPKSLPKHRRIVPLFPNYLFVQVQISEEYHYVIWSPGVKRLVGFDGTPTPLDEEVVRLLMQQASPEGIIAARSNLMAGQEVTITAGSFNGLVGIIQHPPDARGRVNLLLNLLSRQVKVAVPIRFVKSGWVVAEGAEGHRIPSPRS